MGAQIVFDSSEDTAAEWARRKENIREALRLFRLLASAVKKHATSTEECWQISSAQLWALHEIGRNPGMRNLDLAKSMAIHVVKASEISDLLNMRGFLLGADTAVDAKSIRLFLSEEGAALVENTPFPTQGVLTAALENVDDKVLAELNKALQVVVNAAHLKENQAALTPLTDIMQPPGSPRENGDFNFNITKGASDESTD